MALGDLFLSNLDFALLVTLEELKAASICFWTPDSNKSLVEDDEKCGSRWRCCHPVALRQSISRR